MELALLQPGVASFNEKDSGAGSSNRGTKLNINGMTFRSNSYLLDGANMRGYPGTVTGSAAAIDARRRNDSGIPRRDQRVFGRLRPRDGRRRQPRHEERHEHRPRLGLRVLPRQRAGRARLLRPRRGPAAVPQESVRRQRSAVRSGRTVCSSSAASNGCRRTSAPRRRRTCRATRRAPAPSAPVRATVRPYLDLFPLANGGDLGVNTGVGVFSFEHNQPTRETFYQGRLDYTLSAERHGVRSVYGRRRRSDEHGRIPRLRRRLAVEEPVPDGGVQADRHARAPGHHPFLAQPASSSKGSPCSPRCPPSRSSPARTRSA